MHPYSRLDAALLFGQFYLIQPSHSVESQHGYRCSPSLVAERNESLLYSVATTQLTATFVNVCEGLCGSLKSTIQMQEMYRLFKIQGNSKLCTIILKEILET